jgi:hypothetical protein
MRTEDSRGGEVTPRFKGVPKFDFALPYPLCGYKIQPMELIRTGSHMVKCPSCGGIFDELAGKTRRARLDRNCCRISGECR